MRKRDERTFWQAIRAWLADFPRRAYRVTGDDLYLYLNRRVAAQHRDEANKHEASRPDMRCYAGPVSVVDAGWMRPSEYDAIPEI